MTAELDEARRIIHDNDVARLRSLIAEHPALLSAQEDGGVLALATDAYGDVFDPQREKDFTRPDCAALLLDAGAIVTRAVLQGMLDSRARGLLAMFNSKGRLPRTLPLLAALGDVDGVRAALATGLDQAAISEAFLIAVAFEHRAIAAMLLERAIEIDADLHRHVVEIGADAFITSLGENRPHYFSRRVAPWDLYCRQQLHRALHDDDREAFVRGLDRAPWLLGEATVEFQAHLVEQAAFHGRDACIAALWDRDPALLHQQPPPATKAFEHAMTYAKTHVIPQLTRLWPFPDDVPHRAGMGDLRRVTELLGAAAVHQPTLDTALAYAVINHHFAVADLLLERGADINTDWNSHEPASILHHLVFEDDYAAMQYLIDRGIDPSITDYRWHSTAEGWARHGKNDPAMADWLRSRLYNK